MPGPPGPRSGASGMKRRKNSASGSSGADDPAPPPPRGSFRAVFGSRLVMTFTTAGPCCFISA